MPGKSTTPSANNHIGTDLCTLVVTRSNGCEILCLTEDAGLVLPSIAVDPSERYVEQINREVRKLWGIQTYSLGIPIPDASDLDLRLTPFHAMECISPDQVLPPNMAWIAVSSLEEKLSADSLTLRRVKAIADCIRQCATDSAPCASHFCFRDLSAWVQAQIRARGLQLTGRIQQFTADAGFHLLRLGTNQNALWYKSVGETNAKEFRFTSCLASLFPQFLPTVIAFRPECNAWLMYEAEGATLGVDSAFSSWQTAVRSLSELQILSGKEATRLSALGLRDVRPDSLLTVVDEFFEFIDGVMHQQTKQFPAPLTAREILNLKLQVTESLVAFSDCSHSTLNHLDINPYNIVVSGDHCTFLDWAEAAFGPPFLTLQYLLEHFTRRWPHNHTGRAELISQYVKQWRELLPPSEIAQGLSLSPLIATFAYAVSNDCWRQTTSQTERHRAYFRGLARRMKYETDAFGLGRTKCFYQ
jgi:hypothetical protein